MNGMNGIPGGPLQPGRLVGRAEARVEPGVAGRIADGVRQAADGVAGSLRKLGEQLDALDASRGEIPRPDMKAIEEFLKKQMGPENKPWNPMDIAPMYGMAWKPPVDGPKPDPIDIAPMYGIAWKPPVDGPNPIDIAPMYGISWKPPVDGPNPIDIAPMYGIAWKPPVDPGHDAPAPIDFAPMYGMAFPRPLPIDLGTAAH